MKKSQKSHFVLPILLVDDQIYTLEAYEMQLRSEGITDLVSCQSGGEALDILSSHDIAIIVLDLSMPEMSGEEVLNVVVSRYPEVPVIITTAIDDVGTAVRCMQAGAFDYLVKPVRRARLITTIRRALEFRELQRENVLLKERFLDNTLKHPEAFSKIITNNPQMHSTFRYIESIAVTSQPVLITGETGVGKELVARAIHRLSRRKGGIVVVNVAGLDDNTFSDTLFGHKRGAFTGADRARDGLIEKAANGTLFLDEIGDLHPTSQVKLLRLFQEREYYPLGADAPKRTNTRVIVATNHDVLDLQQPELFRADLYYRLMLHHIHIPPLRERRDDISLLVKFFLQRAANELGKTKPTPPPELFTLLSMYDFPGNIRELQAMIFDAVSRHESRVLSLDSFKEIIRQQPSSEHSEPTAAITSTIASLYACLDRLPTLKEAEEYLILETLKRTGGNQTLSATLLGTSRQTLRRRIQTRKEFSVIHDE